MPSFLRSLLAPGSGSWGSTDTADRHLILPHLWERGTEAECAFLGQFKFTFYFDPTVAYIKYWSVFPAVKQLNRAPCLRDRSSVCSYQNCLTGCVSPCPCYHAGLSSGMIFQASFYSLTLTLHRCPAYFCCKTTLVHSVVYQSKKLKLI